MAAKSCAHLLEEEAVCLERDKSLFVLGGDIYSRLPSLDAHYEKTSSTKRNIPQPSLPRTDTRYINSQSPKYAEILIPSERRCSKMGLHTLVKTKGLEAKPKKAVVQYWYTWLFSILDVRSAWNPGENLREGTYRIDR
ncbi:hypothetical protein G6F42_021342 [Rhizopus arrhizus]|nr:hypothetical protein G6F42_021342 [Rhizopus arrhizus]